MKLAKMLMAGVLVAGISATTAMADYNKGYKYYGKYIKKSMTSSAMLKFLNIQTQDELDEYLDNNAEKLIKALKEKGKEKAAKGVEKIVKKHKLNDLKDFLDGIVNGKIPAGC